MGHRMVARLQLILGLLAASLIACPANSSSPRLGDSQHQHDDGTWRSVSSFGEHVQVSRSEESLEYKLASIDAGRRVAPNDLTVARFRSLLDQLSSKYSEDRQQIADMTVVARDSLREDGVEESLLNIMEGMNQLFHTRADLRYAEFSAAYMTLRASGQNHSQALSALRAILQSLGVF